MQCVHKPRQTNTNALHKRGPRPTLCTHVMLRDSVRCTVPHMRNGVRKMGRSSAKNYRHMMIKAYTSTTIERQPVIARNNVATTKKHVKKAFACCCVTKELLALKWKRVRCFAAWQLSFIRVDSTHVRTYRTQFCRISVEWQINRNGTKCVCVCVPRRPSARWSTAKQQQNNSQHTHTIPPIHT